MGKKLTAVRSYKRKKPGNVYKTVHVKTHRRRTS